MGKFRQFSTELTALDTSVFWFVDNNFSKYHWIFTKFGTCMCIDIMKIWFQIANQQILSTFDRVCGWSGVVKVSCILRHRGIQLILAYSWTKPAILVAGKGIGGMFLYFLFLHFHSCSSFFPVPLFHRLCYLFYLFFPFCGRMHKMTYKG